MWSDLRAQLWLPGTEFLDAETKRQKWPFKRVNACRDENLGNELAGNPRRNALFGVASETRGLQGLDGGVRSHMRTSLPCFDPVFPRSTLFLGEKWPI